MNTNIILSGVGGQGILTIAAVLDTAALSENLNVKQSEVHGMSQRGGAVQSHVRISDDEIYSDLIPEGKADMILSVEPMELLRYIPYLKEGGWLITDSKPFENILDYPRKDKIYKQIKMHKNHIIINATSEAKKIGNSKAANMVLLGAASTLLPIPEESMTDAIKKLFERKSEKIVKLNLEAFAKGKELAQNFTEFVFCE
ncbi:MAG: indolepyruvate oxidoreductase subunit beta [Bacteroidota bacterium]